MVFVLDVSFIWTTKRITTEPSSCLMGLLTRSALSLLSWKQSRFLSPASASSLAREQGGNYRLAHTHALGHTAVCPSLGQSPNDARRARKPDCQRPPRSFCAPTALPLNKINQRILSVLVFSVAWTLRFRLGLRSQPSAAPALSLGTPRSGRFGSLAVGLASLADALAPRRNSPLDPPSGSALSGGHAAAWRSSCRSLHTATASLKRS